MLATMRSLPALTGALAATLVGISGAPALAEGRLIECDARASAANLVEPWSENTRSYAEGAVRVAALIDADAPACCRHFLLVLAPAGAEAGDAAGDAAPRQCLVVGGFHDLDVGGIGATYSPHIGLLLSVPVWFWLNPEDMAPDAEPFADRMKLLINQETGSVTIE